MSESQLVEFFQQFLAERGIELSAHELPAFNFVASGLLDSFEILSMIMHLESSFGISVSPESISDPKNGDVAGLISTLLEQQ